MSILNSRPIKTPRLMQHHHHDNHDQQHKGCSSTRLRCILLRHRRRSSSSSRGKQKLLRRCQIFNSSRWSSKRRPAPNFSYASSRISTLGKNKIGRGISKSLPVPNSSSTDDKSLPKKKREKKPGEGE